jgi:hypothetical protein
VCKEEEVIVRRKARENCVVKSFNKSYEKIKWSLRYEGYRTQIWEMANACKIENSKEETILGDQRLMWVYYLLMWIL